MLVPSESPIFYFALFFSYRAVLIKLSLLTGSASVNAFFLSNLCEYRHKSYIDC